MQNLKKDDGFFTEEMGCREMVEFTGKVEITGIRTVEKGRMKQVS